MGLNIGELTWSDYPPDHVLSMQNASSGSADRLIDEFVAEMAGGKSTLSEHDREWIVANVESQAQLLRLFERLPGHAEVIPRIHDFMHRRHRTPSAGLSPGAAVQLATSQMVAFGEYRHRLLEKRRNVPQFLDEYVDRLLGLEVRWVDAETATPGAIEFDGKSAILGPSRWSSLKGTVFSQEELGTSGLVDNACAWLAEVDHVLTGWLNDEENGAQAFMWDNADRDWLGRTTDYTYSSLRDYLLSPVYEDRLNAEPYFRLWKGGASLWIGADSLEVRTDWARRWGSNYRD